MRGLATILAGVVGALGAAGCEEARDAPAPFDAGLVLDATPRDFGAPPRPDARPRDLGPGPDLGSIDAGSRPEAGVLDLGVPAEPGEICELARPWSGAPLVASTTVSRHRARLVCSAPGAAGRAPEAWWRLAAGAQPERIRLEVGAAGFSASVATRPAGCERAGERCAAAPPVLELPVVSVDLPVAVEGFSGGAGRYVLVAERGPPLTLPPRNAACDRAPALEVGTSTLGHDFSAPAATATCELDAAVYYLAPPAGTRVVIRARGGQRLAAAWLPACGGAPVACASAEPGDRALELVAPSGASHLAVGHRGEVSGSFALGAARSGCLLDRDCPLGQICSAGACAGSGAVVDATRRPIPDLGELEVPLAIDAGPSRGARVRVRIALEHPFPEDLVVTLRSPSGITVRLRDRRPGALDAVYGADRAPDGPGRLLDFGVGPVTGIWQLRVRDAAAGDTGALLGVALEVE